MFLSTNNVHLQCFLLLLTFKVFRGEKQEVLKKVLFEIGKWLDRFDCLVIGPGLGRDPFLMVNKFLCGVFIIDHTLFAVLHYCIANEEALSWLTFLPVSFSLFTHADTLISM